MYEPAQIPPIELPVPLSVVVKFALGTLGLYGIYCALRC